MKFTRKDVADNKVLVSFLRTRLVPERTTVAKNSFHRVCVYDTKTVISELEDRIKSYKVGSYQRFVPQWQKLVEYLKEMEK